MTRENVRALLAEAARRGADYIEGLHERRVEPPAGAVERLMRVLDQPLPDSPASSAEVLSFLDEYGSPATVASAGGRYFGFVTGGALPATVAAQYVAAAWDQNSFSFTSSPAVACFEATALRWVKEALGLPQEAEGALVTGATMANFTCLAAARNHVLARAGWDVDRNGLYGAPALTVIAGAEAHASLYKVLAMLGMGRDHVVRVAADEQGRFRPDRLPRLEGPSIVCIQAGNVNSGAFDPAEPIVEWARNSNAWIHVDGAFGLWALASPAHRELTKGFASADSWAMDAHKWLNVPYDSGVAIVRDAAALGQAMSINGSYLLPSGRRDAINYTPDSSRRARAVEIWAAFKSLGRTGLIELIERNCRQARALAQRLRDHGVEVLNDVVLNQVVTAFGDDERTRRVIAAVQASGVCWCGGSTWKGRAVMRISVSSWATTDEDIERSAQSILEAHRGA